MNKSPVAPGQQSVLCIYKGSHSEFSLEPVTDDVLHWFHGLYGMLYNEQYEEYLWAVCHQESHLTEASMLLSHRPALLMLHKQYLSASLYTAERPINVSQQNLFCPSALFVDDPQEAHDTGDLSRATLFVTLDKDTI